MFNIPFSILQNRLHSYKSTFQGYKNQQLLTSTKESTLVKWVSRLLKGGFPISLPLTLELAKEIRLNQYSLPPPLILPPPITSASY
jgi:hypothetical protein